MGREGKNNCITEYVPAYSALLGHGRQVHFLVSVREEDCLDPYEGGQEAHDAAYQHGRIIVKLCEKDRGALRGQHQAHAAQVAHEHIEEAQPLLVLPITCVDEVAHRLRVLLQNDLFLWPCLRDLVHIINLNRTRGLLCQDAHALLLLLRGCLKRMGVASKLLLGPTALLTLGRHLQLSTSV